MGRASEMACNLGPMKSHAALLLLFMMVSIAGCSLESESQRPSLGVDNGTTLAVTLTVNGTEIETVPPQTQRVVGADILPPLPWNVRAVSPSGRLLLDLEVVAGSVSETTDANGGTSMRGAGNRVDLSCGRLDVYAGPPLVGPMPGPGTPGDCEP
jgi:hypothetical protein